MGNPFSQMANAPMPGPFGNMQRMMQWFNPSNFMQQVRQFRSQFQQNADPQKIVMDMANKGQISQDQLNVLQQVQKIAVQQVEQFQQMTGGVK